MAPQVSTSRSALALARQAFHQDLIERGLLTVVNGVVSNADSNQKASKFLARSIADQIGGVLAGNRLSPQRTGKEFENACAGFIEDAFALFDHLRPADWEVLRVPNRKTIQFITKYEQYAHLATLNEKVEGNETLRSALGNAYEIAPDVVISRAPLSDRSVNSGKHLVDDAVAKYSPLRMQNQSMNLLHAVLSCKWTFRSDRAQNARSESLNLLRNRKGRAPHIVVVTAEPTPKRLASLALGTGDIDCLYHFALPELQEAVDALGDSESSDLMKVMVTGKRIKDIADLPLDLAI